MALRTSNLPEEDKADIGQLRNQEGVGSSSAGSRLRSSGTMSSGTGSGSWRYNPSDNQAGTSTAGGATSSTSSTPSSLRNKEKSPSISSTGSSSDSTSEDPSKYSNDQESSTWKTSLSSNSTGKRRAFFKITKKRTAAGIGTIAILAGVWGGFSVVHGPLSIVHFGKLLERFHLEGNNTFGDERSSKMLIYALLGKTERGRLGVTGNIAADKWEARLIKEFGVQPVYTNTTGRFAGFRVVDSNDGRGLDQDSKAMRFLTQVQEAGKVKVRAGNDYGGRQAVKTTDGTVLGRRDLYIDVRDLNPKEKRFLLRSVSKAMNTFKITAALNARLLIKRGGVAYKHFFNEKLSRTIDNAADRSEANKRREDYEKNVLKRLATSVKTGIKKGEGKNQQSRDLIEQVEQETEGKSAAESRVLRTAMAKAAGPAAVIGTFCGVKSLGDDAEDTKYLNNALPMMRLAMAIVSMSSQITFGDNTLNMDEVGAVAKQLYDEESGTTVMSARSVQAELGQQQTGPAPPREARLTKMSDKGDVFETVDFIASIPLPIGPANALAGILPGVDSVTLGTACGIIDTISGLPVISTINSLLQAAIDQPLGLAGTSTEELMGELLSVINGANINPLAQGAELGNLANIGGHLSGLMSALTMGGAPLRAADAVSLQEEQNQIYAQENSEKSFTERYFDPYNTDSLAASFINSMPTASSENISSSFASLFSSSMGNLFTAFAPKASAALGDYDYGIPAYGYTLQERENTAFEDPYENAAVIEQPGVLEGLNEKYGKPCFGMTVNADDTGVHIESEGMDSENVNIFKVRKNHPECDPANNNDFMFLRYRFYLADSVTAVSLACYEADDAQACSEIGAGGSSSADESQASPVTANATVDFANLGKSSDQLECAADTKDLGVVTSKYTGEYKKESGPMKIRLCQIKDIPGNGNDTDGNIISGGAVVEARVSGAWAALAKKAKRDGVSLSASSSFRLADSCGGTGDGTGCARPGQSAHQTGWAIDFADMGGFSPAGSYDSCSGRMTHNSPQWKWMRENAEDFGIKQYSAESWHWDFLPTANRCGK